MSTALLTPWSAIPERDLVSLGLAAAAVVLVLMAGQIRLSSETELLPPTITVTTVEAPPEQKKQPVAEPQKPEPKPQATPSPIMKSTVTEKVSAVDDSANTPAPSAPSRPSQSAASLAAPSPELRRVDLDRDFENKIRSVIEASKRYPTGREASLQKPQGVVVACVVLQRDGSLQDMKIQKSSTYPILDNAAKRLLANLQYPPIPTDIFPGQASHAFCVNLDYKVPA
jgi:protein TonB